jgi:hypothetical protein
MAYITIDGHAMPEPQKLDIGFQEIGKTERLASGRMVADIVTTKKTFTMTWPFIHWSDLQYINEVFLAGDFVTMLYPYGGVLANSAVVKIMDVGPESLRYVETAADDWMYTDITVTAEEQ